MINDSTASDYEKSLISGHYIFSNKEFLHLKRKIETSLKKKKINLNQELKSAIKYSIMRYLKSFRLI